MQLSPVLIAALISAVSPRSCLGMLGLRLWGPDNVLTQRGAISIWGPDDA